MPKKLDEPINNRAQEFFDSLATQKRCYATTEERGIRWFCALPLGHKGHHCRIDMDLRYFTGEGPTFRIQRTGAIHVKDLLT